MKNIIRGAALVLLLLPAAGTAQDFDQGIRAFDAGDYESALREWRPLAELGDADAQRNLGTMYRQGIGVPQDYMEAVRWYRMAAEQGLSDAQVSLGNMYRIGEGVPQDYAEAIRWTRAAAEQGDVTGQFNLGQYYAIGEGIEKDQQEAFRWHNAAARQAHGPAQMLVAFVFAEGRIVPQDYISAHMWLVLATVNINTEQGERLKRLPGPAQMRDSLAEKMTPADISEAQRRARLCISSQYRECD